MALDEGEYAERALEAVQQARRIGITNTPTIFLGKTRVNGWTYYEVLQSVMEQQGALPSRVTRYFFVLASASAFSSSATRFCSVNTRELSWWTLKNVTLFAGASKLLA